MAPPGVASAMSTDGTPSPEELEAVQEVLDQMAHLVPEGSLAIRVIMPPDLVISPLPTLPTMPQLDPLKAPLAMPDDIMDSEMAPPEKAAGVDDIDMTDT
ncbi:MAG: hypothetical protein GY832_36355, partial [Chloroflexi bacterium]|nr:hypothetical protein [Chloroflexota bacterium]